MYTSKLIINKKIWIINLEVHFLKDFLTKTTITTALLTLTNNSNNNNNNKTQTQTTQVAM